MRAYAIAIAAWMVSLASCASEDEPRVCYFPSGRPCVEGDICMNTQGNECEPVICTAEGRLEQAAAACVRGQVDPVPGGPYDCDQTHLDWGGGLLPPRAPCPLGSMVQIAGTTYGMSCIPVAQCIPLPCDPQYNGDGCPIDYVCDAASSTCVPGAN